MQPLIEFKNTSFSASSEKRIINNITVNINPGDFVVILGGNGSGKSSFIKLLNKTYSHTSGEILFKNKPINSYDFKSLRQELITITQYIGDSLFLDLTIEENSIIINSSYSHSQKKSAENLSAYLSHFNKKLSHALKTRVKYLSGGEQQMLAFALYLRHQPDLLLLDEPTSALDPKKANHVMEFIAAIISQKNITCLMTTHQLDFALKYGNRLIAIREGEIIFEANKAEKEKLTMADLLRYCY